jgi:hypothetical protein
MNKFYLRIRWQNLKDSTATTPSYDPEPVSSTTNPQNPDRLHSTHQSILSFPELGQDSNSPL